ncbi:MAG TPA: tetratricopeptide repeat protein [Acetobacteraceae bacterium]|nr:tetratricopeptide repeat protein [Acetobacteraceae bacterium]
MPKLRLLRRPFLLVLSLLSACAAGGAPSAGTSATGRAYGAFLDARFADSQFALDRSADYYREASRADPADPVLRQQAFLASLMAGDAETASLAAGVPDNQVAELFQIDQAVLRGDWQGAITRIRDLPQEGLTEILSPLLLAWAEQGAGRTDAALATLQPYLNGPEARGIDALHAGMIADLAGRTALADKYYSMADQGFAAPNLQVARAIASWQARRGQRAEARATIAAVGAGGSDLALVVPNLERDVAARPVTSPADGMAEAYLAIGASLQQEDSPDFTVILLRLALALNPDLTPARLLLADVLDTQDQPAAALAVLATVGDADPLAPIVEVRRALLLDHLGKVNDALAVLDRLAAQYPDQPDPLEAKGDILRSHERWQEAITAYDGAIARIGTPGPSDWTLFYDRGIAYDQVHEWPQAEPDFRKALELQPNQPYVLNYLGYSWAVQGRHLPEARQMIAKAAELRPNDGAILDSLGYVMLRQGDTSGALHWLLRAVTLEPDDPTINGHLGDAYWAVGNKLAARYQWQLALSLHPTPSEAATLQSKLGGDYGEVGVAPAPGASTAESHKP